MGDIIESVKVKSLLKKQAHELKVYFDSGSPDTFISVDKAKELGGMVKLPEPCEFRGLGNGGFLSHSIIILWFNLLGIWCKHATYVIDSKETGEEADILVGHDLMQKYNIKLDPKRQRIILDKASLKRAQVVR